MEIDYDFGKFKVGKNDAFGIAARGKVFDDVVRDFVRRARATLRWASTTLASWRRPGWCRSPCGPPTRSCPRRRGRGCRR
jgi:hypothetical protein